MAERDKYIYTETKKTNPNVRGHLVDLQLDFVPKFQPEKKQKNKIGPQWPISKRDYHKECSPS